MTKNNNNVMIVESLTASPFSEATSPITGFVVPDGMMLVEGILGVAGVMNRNNRYYTFAEYQRHVDAFAQRIAEEGGVFGEMEHPKSMTINLHNVSHRVMSIRMDQDGNVYGKLLLLDTPTGKIAQSIVRSGAGLPVSSRALGKVDPKTGETKLDYLATYDLVGTSGFKQASQYQVSESFEASNFVVESASYCLDDNSLEIVKESTNENLALPNDIDSIIEAKVNERLAMLSPNSAAITEEQVDALFATKYSPIIENWLNTAFLHNVCEGIQSWAINEFAPQIQSWVTEQYTPAMSAGIQSWAINEFAPQIQSWVTEQYTPAMSAGMQSWAINEFAPQIQSWVTEEFAPELSIGIQTWFETNESLAIAQPVKIVESAQNVNESVVIAEPAVTSTTFKSAILESVDAKINFAATIDKPVQVVESIDEAHFKTGPNWLRNIPAQHKQAWTILTESQKDEVYRRASIRSFTSPASINVFWDSINFESIVESSASPAASAMQRSLVTESANEPVIANKNVFELAKHMQKSR